MKDATRQAWEQVLARVNASLGADYELVGPLTGGRQGGAWVVRARGQDPVVLTWTVHPGLAARREQTATLVGQLIERGYPATRWHHWGAFPDGLAYAIADFVAARPSTWDALPIDRVLAAIEMQDGVAAAAPPGPTWSDYTWQTLRAAVGPRADVAALGLTGTDFLAAVDAAVDAAVVGRGDVELPVDDAVHGDLETTNILLGGAQGIVIVDLGAFGAGTRALDYAWLLRDGWTHDAAPATLRRVRAAGEAVAGPGVFAVCLALACLELVAFVARSGDRSQAVWQAAELLPLLDGAPH